MICKAGNNLSGSTLRFARLHPDPCSCRTRWARPGRLRYARVAGISLSLSILASELAVAQRVEEARVALAAPDTTTPAAAFHAWSEPRREIPLGPFVVAGAVVGAVLAVRSLVRSNTGDDWVDPMAGALSIGRGVALGAVLGLTVGAVVREIVRKSDRREARRA